MAIAGDRGGYGWGSGGLIVLQGPMITLAPSARIFANGGAGGDTAGDGAGSPRVDPDGSTSGGSGGRPGLRGGSGSPPAAGPDIPRRCELVGLATATSRTETVVVAAGVAQGGPCGLGHRHRRPERVAATRDAAVVTGGPCGLTGPPPGAT